MDYIFICKKCGNIQNVDWEIGTPNIKCTCCNEVLSWSDAFPPQTVIDFNHTVNSLYELSKQCDKENLTNQFNILKRDGIKIDKTTLDKYINKYEKHLEKYPNNDDTIWNDIDNTFEEELLKEMDIDMATRIHSVLICFKRNEFRKTYVIMAAALIEQLFHDYFVELISLNLSEYGKQCFLKKYETSGIQSVIDISNSFLNEDIKVKMGRYSNGFFDKWKALRKLRNSIVHSNNIYISKVKIAKIKAIINDSFIVFKNLKSELYRN